MARPRVLILRLNRSIKKMSLRFNRSQPCEIFILRNFRSMAIATSGRILPNVPENPHRANGAVKQRHGDDEVALLAGH